MQALQPILSVPRFIESARLAPFKQRGTDVDVVLDLMIHDIDLILSIVGSPVVSVDAIGSSVFSKEIDIANARLRFANGCVANATASRVSLKTERRLRLFQDDAYVSVDLHQKVLTVIRKTGRAAADGMPLVDIQETTYDQGDALKAEIEAFLAAAAAGREPPVTGEDGLNGAQGRTGHQRAGGRLDGAVHLAGALAAAGGTVAGAGTPAGGGGARRVPSAARPRRSAIRHGDLIHEEAGVGEACARHAGVLGVVQLHLVAHDFLELSRDRRIAHAELPDLRRDAGHEILSEIALDGLADPAAVREFLQHAGAGSVRIRPGEREPGPERRSEPR